MTKSRQQRRAADRAANARERDALGRQRLLVVGGVLLAGVLAWAGIHWTEPGPPAREGSPAWSPDGQRIVYYAEQSNGNADLYIMNADGSQPSAVLSTPDADEGGPAFSPDGRQVAYDTDQDGNFEIYFIDLATLAPRRLTTHAARDVSPAWSPDGTRIAFMSDRDSAPAFDLYLMNADGTGVERLTTTGTNWFPQFSPNGQQMAFHRGDDVHIMDLETRAIWRLTTTPANGMYPSWSPDGGRLAFMSWRNGRTEVFLMDAYGQDQRPLVSTSAGGAIDPRWSPDGSRLVYVQVPEARPTDAQDPLAARAIYVVEVASGRVTRLSR